MRRCGNLIVIIMLFILVFVLNSYSQTASILESYSSEELREIVRRIVVGNVDVIKLMRYTELNSILEPVEREIERQRTGSEPVHFFGIFTNQSISSFLGGLNNRDPQVRIRCAGIVMIYLAEANPLRAQLQQMKQLVQESINAETVDEANTKLGRVMLFINRLLLVDRVNTGDVNMLKNMPPDEFISLITGIEELGENDVIPLNTLHHEHIEMLINGLDSQYIGIRASCASALRRIYGEQQTPQAGKDRILQVFRTKLQSALDNQWDMMAQYITELRAIAPAQQ